MNKIILGHLGEDLAVNFLVKKGYTIAEQNFRRRVGAIDIIAHDPIHQEWVFVEVKTRQSHAFGRPEEAVKKAKIAKMSTAAQLWLHKRGENTKAWRLDVIAITIEANKEPQIDHFENIS